jgi:hypothetical protein
LRNTKEKGVVGNLCISVCVQERERHEQELLDKLKESNKKGELVRLNKEKILAKENTPESA